MTAPWWSKEWTLHDGVLVRELPALWMWEEIYQTEFQWIKEYARERLRDME
jgi:hypothetical protein